MKFRGPPGSVYTANNLRPLQNVMCKRGPQRRRRGKEALVAWDPRSLEENMFKEARSIAVAPCSRAQLAEYILALEECRSLVTLIKAA